MNIPVLRVDGVEADDIIGTVANNVVILIYSVIL